MVTIKEYSVPQSLEEAYKILISKKNNVILGGCGFIKLSNKNIGTAIDLKDVNLDYIKEDEKNILIGADTSLRSLEINKTIKNYCSGIVSGAVSNIVGVQFRQGARIGASVFSKYGFSDLITALLVVGAKVRLYNSGILELNEFLDSELNKDILIEVILPKKDAVAVFDSIRKCTGDFAILNSAMLKENDTYKIAIGARPQRAKLALEASQILSKEKDIDKASIIVGKELIYGSNMRASKEYRIDMASALLKRMYSAIEGGNK
ncbi:MULTISPECIES: FAD binding domain-containing protein [unclassified Clostridioides]|uniref:FAD binding domain-containing protein n=1 Tax=unclassified Clostridioides TaxID=2635829 RepID=UPI001D0C4417|nr:FAD binding domain-containing protein [Clostridioides sp. ES-S-0001-03]UDN60057.1 FAD binding domain-containing protein [Clostridioides sp. ES-S-0010-02]